MNRSSGYSIVSSESSELLLGGIGRVTADGSGLSPADRLGGSGEELLAGCFPGWLLEEAGVGENASGSERCTEGCCGGSTCGFGT